MDDYQKTVQENITYKERFQERKGMVVRTLLKGWLVPKYSSWARRKLGRTFRERSDENGILPTLRRVYWLSLVESSNDDGEKDDNSNLLYAAHMGNMYFFR